ncbi:MAG: porin [Gammaproteobacteria bacterium]|nr:MAG: porin [Gammaproteobacteria bacterium]
MIAWLHYRFQPRRIRTMLHISSRLAALFPLCILAAAAPATEDPLLVLTRLLHDNGTLSDEAYRTMRAAIEARLAHQPLRQVATKKPDNRAAEPSMTTIDQRGRLEFRSPDGAFRTRIGGRVQADYDAFDSDVAKMGGGSEIRRARLFASGTLWRVWDYKLQYDFVNTGRAGIKDAWIGYTALPLGSVKMGHFKEPWSLDDQTSSKYVTFIERALPEAFSPGRAIGLGWSGAGLRWSAAVGLFGEGVGKPAVATAQEGYAVSGRATFLPLYSDGNLLHLGLSASWRDTGSGSTLRFRTRPEAHGAGVQLVDTGDFDADSLLRFGAEVSWVHGPFNLQGEYMGVAVDRAQPGRRDPYFDGWYLEGSWFLTGESRHYRQGRFAAVTPKASVGDGGWGAWEIGLRYSGIDLSDEDIAGGEERNFTAGVNWYPVPNLRFMANYVQMLDVQGGSHDGDEPGVLSLRAQVEF